jgi:hypothetical protein
MCIDGTGIGLGQQWIPIAEKLIDLQWFWTARPNRQRHQHEDR